MTSKSVFQQASDERQSKKQRCKGVDTGARALRSLETHFGGAENVEAMAGLVDEMGRSPIDFTEEEIVRQGMHYTLDNGFWTSFNKAFGIKENPVELMENKPLGGATPFGLSQALLHCYSTNTCIRGRSMKALRAELSLPGPFSDTCIYGVAKLCYGLPTQSRKFKDTIMSLALTFFARHRLKK